MSRNTVTPSVGPVPLRTDRGSAFAHGLIFALLWCGVVALHIVVVWRKLSWPPRGGEIIPVVVLSLFVLFGVGLLARVIAQGLRLAAPHLEITCGRGSIARGVPTTFSYRLSGRPEEFRSLVVWLVGKRRLAERHGREIRIVIREVYRAELLNARTPHAIGQGFFQAELDADAPPSGGGARDRVLWSLIVSGERPGHPDIHDTYRIVVT